MKSSWCVVLAAVALSSAARADFDVPGFRGGVNTTYQQWEVFSSLAGPNFPDVADDNANGSAQLSENSLDGFITSGGNIYSPTAVLDFDVSVPDFGLGAGFATNVVVQIRGQGSDVDPASVLWNGVAADSVEILFEQVLGGFGGTLRDRKFVWNNVPGSPSSNLLTFQAAESSLSLDRLAIDTQTVPVPEPSSWFLCAGVGAVVLIIRSRRVSQF